MTYASLGEAWGGISGSSMTQIPMNNGNEVALHPAHRRQLKRRRNPPPEYKTDEDRYQCTYGEPGHYESCNKVFHRNQNYNNEKKQIAMGMQPSPPGAIPYGPGGGFTLLPQYPWYEWAKYNYMMYGPQVSQAFYSQPWQHYPHIAQQIQQYQNQHPNNYMVPIGQYSPQGFLPGYYSQGIPPYAYGPPLQGLQGKDSKGKVEHFTNSNGGSGVGTMKNITIIFIFFLIVLSIVLCLFLLAFSCNLTNNNKTLNK